MLLKFNTGLTIYATTGIAWNLLFRLSAIFRIAGIFHFGPSDGCEMVFHCGIDLDIFNSNLDLLFYKISCLFLLPTIFLGCLWFFFFHRMAVLNFSTCKSFVSYMHAKLISLIFGLSFHFGDFIHAEVLIFNLVTSTIYFL